MANYLTDSSKELNKGLTEKLAETVNQAFENAEPKANLTIVPNSTDLEKNEQSRELNERAMFDFCIERFSKKTMERFRDDMIPQFDIDTIFQTAKRWAEWNCITCANAMVEQGIPITEIYGKIEQYINDKSSIRFKRLKSDNTKRYLSVDDLYNYLADNGYSISLNAINRNMIIKGFAPHYTIENLASNLDCILENELTQLDIFKKISTEKVNRYISTIAMMNEYNPVKDLLDSTERDTSKCYLNEFYELLNIPSGDTFTRLLIRKWLMQCLALALYNNTNNPIPPEGVLIAVSEKSGTGKTLLTKVLGVGDTHLYKTGGRFSKNDKDFERRCLTTWICELGEIDQTFEGANGGHIKELITQAIDEYRLQYGRVDQVLPRKSSFYGTCNKLDFLEDDTGTRRYWIVPNAEFNIPGLIDWLENKTARYLWKEIYEDFVKDNHEGYMLTEDEIDRVIERNKAFCKPVIAQDELADYFDFVDKEPNKYEKRWVTITVFKREYPEIAHYSNIVLGGALKRILKDDERRRTKKGYEYYIPMPKF